MTESKIFRVLVVDDQTMTRQYFSFFLKQTGRFERIETMTDAESAVEYCRSHRVDLLIMDVVMRQGINGLDAAEATKKVSPETKIIVVTSMPEVSYIQRAKEIGVDSFWYKEIQEQPMLEVIERTMAGEKVYPSEIPVMKIGNANSSDFTSAELKVLRELTTGATDQEIADKFSLSVATVRTHIRHMLAKTGYRNRVELAIKVRVEGVVIGD